MAIIGSQLAQRQTSTEEIYMHISHKTYLSLSTRQRRICLQIFKVKCVCVSYTVLKWPAQVPSVLKDKHQHMQLLLSNSLHQPISEAYPSSKTYPSLSVMCLCFLNFPENGQHRLIASFKKQISTCEITYVKFTTSTHIRDISVFKDMFVFIIDVTVLAKLP